MRKKTYDLKWYHQIVYRIFFFFYDPILRNRPDIVLLFKEHLDNYCEVNDIKSLVPKTEQELIQLLVPKTEQELIQLYLSGNTLDLTEKNDVN